MTKQSNCGKFMKKKVKNVWKSTDTSPSPSPSLSSSPSSSPSPSLSPSPSPSSSLVVPHVTTKEISVSSLAQRVYANAHAYHINAVSPNSDGETFLSSDDLRINLWNYSITKESFTIVDIKPTNMEDLSEVITSAECHPNHCNIFVYSTSKGSIKLADMRNSALCDISAKVFEEQPPGNGSKSFFSEIISSISDIKFTSDGRYLISRDYLTMKIWDLNMENKPVRTISIHDHIKPKLCDLYENDCIFDKFECAPSASGEFLSTGSYNHHFYLHNLRTGQAFLGEANRKKNPPKLLSGGGGSGIGQRRPLRGGSGSGSGIGGGGGGSGVGGVGGVGDLGENLDFSKKILHSCWNPVDQSLLAVAASNCIFLYNNL
eukprot:TRINITY_DN4487_c0_g1_i1.p1 TRINITY_DN4487_c0_g1~~TRINITY_DN4487_c0_g1_i1.p1  ORF type:complete len:374 (+),score=134.96 TRINITY_DN4487_c0_g1_i1:423-1544(+)